MKKLLSVFICVLFLLSFTSCSQGESGDEGDFTVQSADAVWDSHYDNMKADSISAFQALCSAVRNGEESVELAAENIEDAMTLYYTGFPLSALVESVGLSAGGSGVDIIYKNDRDTHIKLVQEFDTRVSEIAAECGLGRVGSDRYVFNTYNYLCKNVAIDDSVLNSYDTLLTLKGSAQSVSQAFEYLLLIGGVKTSHIVNFDNGINVMSVSQLGGRDYIFCPYCEIKNTQGKGLMYFAMGSERAMNAFMLTGFKYTDDTPLPELSGGDYEKLAACTSYTFDDSKITAACGDFEFIMPFN